MKALRYIEGLVQMVPNFDAEILRDIRPADSWIGAVQTGSLTPSWFDCREDVRKLAEGEAYRPTEYIPESKPDFSKCFGVYADPLPEWEWVKD